MSKIRIRNFGPIKKGFQENDGWLDVKKVTVFIGNQGSGKSTVAKTISILSWLEKSINRGDTNIEKISSANFHDFFKFQKIHSYFTQNTYIEYIGEKYHIIYNSSNEFPIINKIERGNYIVPKIMYIPAERNLLSTINAYNIKGLPDNIFSFAEELSKAQNALNNKQLKLPISNYSYWYSDLLKSSTVIGKDYMLDLSEASSGLQSFIPLFLVTRNLSQSLNEEEETLKNNLSVNQYSRMNQEISKIIFDDTKSEEEKTVETNNITSRYYNRCFINIVEEPEQNLYPTSQWEMLKSLLEFNNMNKGNKLIMTTHSPYIINYLTLAVKADTLKKSIKEATLKIKLQEIVPFASTVNPNDLAIYELDENLGIIKKLEAYNGLPSDENKLNERLGESNELFAKLLEIQQEL